MVNLNAEFLALVGDFECKESYDYFLLGVEYAARISAEIARSQTGAERAIRAKFHLDDDPTHCYVCDRPKDDCACDASATAKFHVNLGQGGKTTTTASVVLKANI